MDFGVDLSALEHVQDQGFPPLVPDRVANIDADFIAYIVACDTKAELAGEKPARSLEHKVAQVREFTEFIRKKAGADRAILHITPSESNKGRRAEYVMQAAYQGNRIGRETPNDLKFIRDFMIQECNAKAWYDREADDGLTMSQYANPHNSIICSSDKDLLMVPGYHLDMKTWEITNCPWDTFGRVFIGDGKMRGYGPKFFFAQCLAGDTADNIKGLPGISRKRVLFEKPTAKFTKAKELYHKYKETKPEKAKVKLEEIKAMLDGYNKVGDTTAVSVVQYLNNGYEAYLFIRELFREYKHFTNYRTGEPITPDQALHGDMIALWMRRTDNKFDVFEYIKEERDK